MIGIPIESRVKLRARVRREKIQEVVLQSLYGASAPQNAVQLLELVKKYIEKKPKLEQRISQAFTRLADKHLIVRVRKNGGQFVPTAKGKKFAESLEMMHRARNVPARWDGKWRIVIFDIWERRRNARDKLRILLKRNGFVKIQHSVWVYPYECEELFVFLRTNLSLGKGILYIVAEEIENDRNLRKAFGLPHD
ncbi:MAG: hypothetical protein AAB899_02055 [Patescibacteria group bacterium]